MNQLVFIESGKTVTDSLTVAEVFGKRHDNVLQDIKNLDCSQEFSLLNFQESTYTNERGRTYPKYIMARDGFTFLVMGYTGTDAARFKEDYIKAFNTMEQKIRQSVPVLTDRQALVQSLKLTAELAEEMDEVKAITRIHDQKLIEIENKVDTQITLDSGQQRRVQQVVAKKVCGIERDKKERAALFRQLHREIKDRWGVSSYKDVLKTDLAAVIRYVEAWVPRKGATA
ncbi:Rha family transcriptional regulator [Paenibacillus larvae]